MNVAFPWEFFEELGEMVYVSDLENNALIYMNQCLRNALGYDGHEAYVGRKCYEVLQGREEPCAFCNNCFLESGKFTSMLHTNPLLNKRFLVRDSLIMHDGKKYRMEIAIDIDSGSFWQDVLLPARGSEILNGCLQYVFGTTNPEQALHKMLEYLGENLSCKRICLFECAEAERVNNTYEWCAEGVLPHQKMLQNVPEEYYHCFFSQIEANKSIMVGNVEEIRKKDPAAYAFFRCMEISSFVIAPIRNDGRTVGFIVAEEMDIQMVRLTQNILEVLVNFVVSLLNGRELMHHLQEMSLHDQLTGALNRNALAEYWENSEFSAVGVIYCDITGLKQMNDVLGHLRGDHIIRQCYGLLKEVLKTELIYRTGGDEFVTLFPDCVQSEFYNRVQFLKDAIRQSEYHIATGCTWSDQQPLRLDALLEQADRKMYQDKREYYALRAIDDGPYAGECRQQEEDGQPKSQFRRFIENTYYDLEVAFRSITLENASSYFYFGDMQKDLFYISDNMRDDFGFENNVVSGWLRLWSQRISTPEFQDLFWQDISAMLRERRSRHNLRYQVRDIYGNIKWMHCYALMKWNEDKSAPLFFSGRLSHQDSDFAVDPVTNFPREYAAFGELDELRTSGKRTQIIGFCLNNITEINSTKGRSFVDRLLKNIANRLTETLSWKMTFHRLEGMRFMAVTHSIQVDTCQDAVQQIRSIVEQCYAAMGIAVYHTCSFGVMEYPCEELGPEDMVENLVALLRLAKAEPKQDFIVYSPESISQIQKMSNMILALEQDVMNDMKNFRVVVQPIVSAKDGRVIGGETLLRWTFEGKDISPAVFIPILERDSMIHVAGRWVFEQTARNCRQMVTYNPDFYLTFNVSLYQLLDNGLLEFMQETIRKYRLDGAHLVAELTESCLEKQPEMLERFVASCEKMGIRIALDDFGSGYSSLRMLLQYPSSIIKLDRSLLQEITDSDQKMHFIQSIVHACHQFGKKVCMEGVERLDQNTIIQDTGCDMIQGYFYYRPMELGAVYRLLDEA